MTFYEKVTSYFYISAVVEAFFFSPNKHISRKKNTGILLGFESASGTRICGYSSPGARTVPGCRSKSTKELYPNHLFA